MSLALTGLLYEIARANRSAGSPLPTLTVAGIANYLDADPNELRSILDAMKASGDNPGRIFNYEVGDGAVAFYPRETKLEPRPLPKASTTTVTTKKPRKSRLAKAVEAMKQHEAVQQV